MLHITHSTSRPSLSYSRRLPTTYNGPAHGATSVRAPQELPYSEPAGLLTPCISSSGASLDRNPVVPEYPVPGFIASCGPPQGTLHFTLPCIACGITSRRMSSHDNTRPTHTPPHIVPSFPMRRIPHIGTTVPSLHTAAAATTLTSVTMSAAGTSGTCVPASMTTFINTTLGDAQSM